ncbi:hypothetical protein FACS1894218_5020 [Bacilli bacterium]|nr:hypothetical protein FACS1894218_5020 [Bacilli bacterium]
MKQKKTLTAKTLRKKKILLSTLIPIGCLAIMTAVAVPVVFTQCLSTKYTIDGENWEGYKLGGWTSDDYQVDYQNKTITYTYKGIDKDYTANNLVVPSKVIYNGQQYGVIIGHDAFSQSTGVKLSGSLTISDGVSSIGDYAFYGCSGLTGGALTIPGSVTTIGSYAFYGCSGLNGDLTILDGVTSIGDDAFAGCSGFDGALKIPNSIVSIGAEVFYGCSNLIDNSVSIVLNKISYGSNDVYYIFNGTWYYCLGSCQNVTATGIPPSGLLSLQDNTKIIADMAFDNCSRLDGPLKIPNSVTSIGAQAFHYCPGLTGDLKIPDSVTSIGDDAFAYC